MHLAPALVGPPAPRLVPRRRDLRRDGAARGRAAGSATPTCSTPGSPRRCGRSRRSAGRRRRRSCAPSTRPTSLSTGARHHLPLGRADGDDGHRVHRRAAVHRRPDPLGDPGARRPADVEVARHRDRPARPDRRATAPTRCASACSRCPRRRTCASTRSASSRARTSRTSCGTPRGSCCCGSRTSRPSRVAGDGRGPLDRLAARAADRAGDRALRGLLDSRTRRSQLYDGFWSEVCDWYLELAKPRLWPSDAAVRDAALGARADADAAAPDHAVRDRGDLVVHARGARAARGVALARAGPGRCSTTRRRQVVGAAIEAVTALRRYRDEAGVPARATLRARAPRRYGARRSTSRGLRGSSS